MDMIETLQKTLGWLPAGVVGELEKIAAKIPGVQLALEKQYAPVTAELEKSLRPYRGKIATHARLPEAGIPQNKVLRDLEAIRAEEAQRWSEGMVSGAVYTADRQRVEFQNQVFSLFSEANTLHSDLWPSISKFEAEIVSMTAGMLGADQAEDICGSVTFGGTESILLALKCYRDRARAEKGIRHPEMITPVTAHVAFEKAAQYFGIKKINTPVGPDGRADVAAVRRAVNRNTIAIVGSAPGFPHGVIDPIAEMSEIARQKCIGFHTDACLGGFILPWARELGYEVADFDFKLPGVTSMSVDTHKFGQASKGTSVVLYRGNALRRYQYFTSTEWPGGMYFSPTISGSRSGAIIAICWATLVSMGRQGYLDAAKKICTTATQIAEGVRSIPELRIIGNPLFLISMASDTLDIFQVMDFMSKRGWNINGMHKPSAIHFCITERHTAIPGIAEHFIADLREAVSYAKENPTEKEGLAPVYGMAATMPLRGAVKELLLRYLDLMAKP